MPNPKNVAAGNVRVLYPGLFSRVKAAERPAAGAARSSPEDALMTGQEGRYVYVVVKADEHAGRVEAAVQGDGAAR